MNIKASLLKNAVASGWTKISVALFRIVQVPLLLHALSVEDYGRWLVLSSLSSWLSLANLGFGTVAANEMSMAAAAGELPKAKGIFSTTVALVLLIFIIGALVVALVAPFISWNVILKLPETRARELTLSVLWLSATIFLSFILEAYGGRFRAAQKAHLAVLVSSFRPWIDLAFIAGVLHFSKRFDYLSGALLCSSIIYLAIYIYISWIKMPTLTFSFREVNFKQFRMLFKKGIAFQAFPLGNALLFQGNILIVQSILGPAAVAIFGTTRTLVRVINQLMEIVNQVIWPELSILLGAGDKQRAARLHRIGVMTSVVTSFISVFILALFGHFLYSWWTGKTIYLPSHLLLLFLLPIPFNALWFTSGVVHMASNKHEDLARRYLFATILSSISCVILSYSVGIEGAALSTIIADLILIPFVFQRSLTITGDTTKGFQKGVKQELGFIRSYITRVLSFVVIL